MKFFIDTGNIDEIKNGIELGLVDGVTTNPSLVAKENRDFDTVVKEILEIVTGPVSLEVVSVDAAGMVEETGESKISGKRPAKLYRSTKLDRNTNFKRPLDV